MDESKSWFFEKINKTDRPLTRLIKKKRGKTQINKIRNERGEISTDTKEIQRIVKQYQELYGIIIVNNYMPTNWTTWMKWINS